MTVAAIAPSDVNAMKQKLQNAAVMTMQNRASSFVLAIYSPSPSEQLQSLQMSDGRARVSGHPVHLVSNEDDPSLLTVLSGAEHVGADKLSFSDLVNINLDPSRGQVMVQGFQPAAMALKQALRMVSEHPGHDPNSLLESVRKEPGLAHMPKPKAAAELMALKDQAPDQGQEKPKIAPPPKMGGR